jgi:hypothetical protein
MKLASLDTELKVKWVFIPNENRERWEKYYDIQSKKKTPNRPLIILSCF